jgi:hypothetical protein
LSISGPAQVTAKAYPGANLITWSFVKDAKSYSVYRQRSDGSDALVLLKTTATQETAKASFSYLDVVGFKNQLDHEVEYTYYVTANSAQSSVTRAVELSSTESGGGGTLINDGASSAQVTANIPLRETKITELVLDPATEILTETSIEEDRIEDCLLITWPNYNPAFWYKVKYDLGQALTLDMPATSNWWNDVYPDREGWDITKYYKTPLFGGTNTLRITVGLGDGLYYKPVEITKVLGPYALTLKAPSFTEGNEIKRTGTSAVITFSPGAGAPTDTVYKLWWIEANGLTDDGACSSSWRATVEVVGDWVAVTGTQVQSSADGNNGGSTDTGVEIKVKVLDTDLDSTKGYLYALYAQTGKETYKLERAPATVIPEESSSGSENVVVATGEFTIVPITGTPVNNHYIVVDKPDIRSAYIYRLSGAGIKTVTKEFSDYPFIDSVEATISAEEDETSSTTKAVNVTIKVQEESQDVYDNDLVVDIYRAVGITTGSGQSQTVVAAGNFTSLKESFSLKNENNSQDQPVYKDDKELKGGTSYVYRFVVKTSGGKELSNTSETVEDSVTLDD